MELLSPISTFPRIVESGAMKSGLLKLGKTPLYALLLILGTSLSSESVLDAK